MAGIEKFEISLLQWDSDKDPDYFTSWVDQFGAVVRTMTHGETLEAYLDVKLSRSTRALQTQPSYLSQDPDFQDFSYNPDVPISTYVPPSVDIEADEADSTSANITVTSTTTSTQSFLLLPAANIKYKDLPHDAIQLDHMLYSILRSNVKGSKNDLLRSVTFPSYIQGIIVLTKHMEICRHLDSIHAPRHFPY